MKFYADGSRRPEYVAWLHMRERCSNPGNSRYARYGGRNIKVCARWLASFGSFYADMGERPSPLYTLERKDNDGNYTPDNCEWATYKKQTDNRGMNKNNKSGIKGVCFTKDVGLWLAQTTVNYKASVLYRGPDFFEACCARKSWEAQSARSAALPRSA